MKVFIQIVDGRTGIYQTAGIEEPVMNEKHIDNALAYFGLRYSDIEWLHSSDVSLDSKLATLKSGKIRDTTKVINLIIT